MSIWFRQISIAALIVAGIAPCPGLRAGPQESEQGGGQEAVPSQVPVMEADPSAGFMEKGFQHLYELNFDDARVEFRAYEKNLPDDPMGKAAEAASYLFEQFNAKGILTSDFFLNDAKFLGGVDGSASQNQNPAFVEANNQARALAKRRLKSNPRDIHGLLALTIADGMESDYDALIIKKQLDGLKVMRQAEAEANILLAIDPSQQDANVALGMSNYVIGCLPGFKRALVWFGGIHGDRVRGMQLMASAAAHGHYLQPFAKVMLALAYEREHQMDRAHDLLAELTIQFPSNPVFARELELTVKK
jgi:hypothetical protein